jgi:2-dehydro-3-deoxygluconokinase
VPHRVTHVLVVGEPMVELLDGSDGAEGRRFGGDALNLVLCLAREGPELHVALASAVGDDASSDALLARCRREGVDVSHLRCVRGAEIGRYRVTVDERGERTFAYQRSHSPFRGALDDGDLLPDPGAVDVLCFSGISIAVIHEIGRDRLFGYAATVRDRGGMVVYDPNHRPALWSDTDEAATWMAKIAPVASIVLASLDDGRQLAGVATARAFALALRAAGAGEVVVTDGPRPCAIAYGDVVREVDVDAPVRVVDTTGAGDAFDAAYLASRLRGSDPVVSAMAGHRLAARVVGHRGAIVPVEERS